MTFVRTSALDNLVKRWSEYNEDVDLARDEIMGLRTDIVMKRSRNNIVGALGEAAMGQYIYESLDYGDCGVPRFDESTRFTISYDTSPLHATTIKDKDRACEREYDGIITIGDTLVILESKVVDSISGIARKKREKSRQSAHGQMRRNRRKLGRIGHRFKTIHQLLRDLSGVDDIAHIYFIPVDTYEQAKSSFGLLQEAEDQFGTYFLPFAHQFHEFQRRANYICSQAKLVRKFRRSRSRHPNLYK